MSDISEAATLQLHLADFAMTDPLGKVNAVGMFVDVLGFDPAMGTTARFTVIAEALVPARLCPVEATLELVLLNEAAEVVAVPGPAGPQALRIGLPVVFDKPGALPNGRLASMLWSRHPLVIDFGNGLPLASGATYSWRLRIDGDDDHARDVVFVVPGAPAPPVIG